VSDLASYYTKKISNKMLLNDKEYANDVKAHALTYKLFLAEN
jgi:hypothetical protein